VDTIQKVHQIQKVDQSEPPPSADKVSTYRPDKVQEAWQAALATSTRLALAVPILAFLMVALSPEEVSVGDFKFKGDGVGELLAVVTALLLVKVARIASRLLAVMPLSEFSVELSESAKPETLLNEAYVRPADLFRAKRGGTEPIRTRALIALEWLRAKVIWAVILVIAVGSLVALANAVWGMMTTPKITAWHFSQAAGGLTIALFAVAAFDVITAIVARWPRRKCRQRWIDTLASCETEVKTLRHPPAFPSPWPPHSFGGLERFKSAIDLHRVAEYCEDEAAKYPRRSPADPWPPARPYNYELLRQHLKKGLF
jgi:hypothetical protein